MLHAFLTLLIFIQPVIYFSFILDTTPNSHSAAILLVSVFGYGEK